jgi:hypothetical protein
MTNYKDWLKFIEYESKFDRALNAMANVKSAYTTSEFSLQCEIDLQEREFSGWHERTTEKELIKDPTMFELIDTNSGIKGKITSAYKTKNSFILQVTCKKPASAKTLVKAETAQLAYANFLKPLLQRVMDYAEDPDLSQLLTDDIMQTARDAIQASKKQACQLTLGENPARTSRYHSLQYPFRDAQTAVIAAAHSLPLSFIWGPPGTGKTHTLGHIVAQLITESPAKKILALSLANRAIEQMVIRADDAYQELIGKRAKKGVMLRTQVPNLAEFKSRTHLTAWSDAEDAHRVTLTELSKERDTVNVLLKDGSSGSERKRLLSRLEVITLKRDEEVESYKLKRTELISNARAVFCTLNQHSWVPELCADYDVVIIEEASMVPMYYVQDLRVTYPNARFIIAGDHQQLQPIIDWKRHKKVETNPVWGQSAFSFFDVTDVKRSPEYTPGSNSPNRPLSEVNLLNIQSRMPSVLGDVISSSFYGGLLLSSRKPGEFTSVPSWPRESLLLIDQEEAAYWVEDQGFEFKTEKLEDNTSRAEAQVAAFLAKSAHEGGSTVTVITPFRNQRTLIKSYLTQLKLPDVVDCSTVHSAQGSEADIIIYSLVRPRHSFLSNDEAEHLHTVAMSRAQQQLVLLLDIYQGERNRYLKKFITAAHEWLMDGYRFTN